MRADLPLEAQLRAFLELFEAVFDVDWAYTQEMLGICPDPPEAPEAAADPDARPAYIIAPGGTFLPPDTDEDFVNWGYRSALLAAYHDLKTRIDGVAR